MAVKKKSGEARGKRVKPLRAHDHIKKDAIEHPQKFHPKRAEKSKEKKVMTTTSSGSASAQSGASGSTGGSGAKDVPDRVPVDARVMQMVVAILPAFGEAPPSADQQKVAEQVEQIMVDALQAQEAKKAKPDEAELKQAEVRFFSGDVAGAEARKKQEEQAKKDAAQAAAAQKAAQGTQAPAKP